MANVAISEILKKGNKSNRVISSELLLLLLFFQGHFEKLEPLIIPVHFPGFVPLSLFIEVNDIPDVIHGIQLEFVFNQFGPLKFPLAHHESEFRNLRLGDGISLQHMSQSN